ncbi:uncharacterized protein FTJAE_1099 [Fusarium tjaetaba]|uniref:BZIP domain-containing protein n=1 Tax=Fusarium tjaetaba TaxID=1567544 RepID=A0A8H5SDM5_9HYPO|nr:uncharacterized protein FTJAE_1099 [Fusarium tjaetaba]KAF5649103.1 hypothetical protein FTJAE_1099 [Fusarium tjaetaba]
MKFTDKTPNVTKWTLNPNPTRVRDNQRRHRARVKARMESLEAQLNATQQELRAARARIHELEAFITATRPLFVSEQGELPVGLGASTRGSDGPTFTTLDERSKQQDLDKNSVAPVFEIPVADVLASTMFSTVQHYDKDDQLPPVAAGESTTLCRMAYEIIEQHNMTGVEPYEIENCLRSGFRRATRMGEGCRVETTILYALIDRINPV